MAEVKQNTCLPSCNSQSIIDCVQIPGRWETLVTRLRQSAEEDCVLFYEAEMSALHKLHQHGEFEELLLLY